jgi:N-acetylneuraminic acid mutarotase
MRTQAALWKTLLVLGIAFVVFSSRNQVFGQSGTWTRKAPMLTPRLDHAVGVVNGILYAVGGEIVQLGVGGNLEYVSTVEAYDPATNRWTARAPMPTPRASFGVGVIDGILYAVGGHGGSFGPVLATVEAYNPATDRWTAKAPMLKPREFFAVGVVNRKLYVVGGGGGPWLSTVDAYDPTTNAWAAMAPMHTARNFLAIGVVQGILYAVGGGCCNPGENGIILSTVEAYNPTTNSWTTKTPMLIPRMKFAVGVVNGTLYAIGGAGPVSKVEAYNPNTNAWTAKAPMPTARFAFGVEVVNGILYVVGGSSLSANNVWPQITGDLLAFKP